MLAPLHRVLIRLVAVPVLFATSAGQTELRKLTPQDPDEFARFGGAVAVSGDTALVGAYLDIAAGAAYVRERNHGGPSAWGQVVKLIDGDINTYFGFSVAIDGDTAVVGAHLQDGGASNTGSAFVFGRDHGGPGAWGQIIELTASDAVANARFGYAVAIAGDTVVIGAEKATAGLALDAGAAYVFERNHGGPGAWGEVTKLTASEPETGDSFGSSVAIVGDTLVVGAESDDHGGKIDAGSACVFERDAGGVDAWGEVAHLIAGDAASQDQFGHSVAVSGGTIVAGAYLAEHSGLVRAGAAYVFDRDQGGAGAWGEVDKLTAGDAEAFDLFGGSVSLSGDRALIGARADHHSGFSNVGSGYLFERSGVGGAWSQTVRIAASDAAPSSEFGSAVSVSGNRAVIGAWRDDDGYSGGDVEGLAFDSSADAMYGTDVISGFDQFLAIAPSTGAGRQIGSFGSLGFGRVRGLALDPNTSTLYGSDVIQDQLITIDTATGVGSSVGALGFDQISGLAFDPVTNTLYGTDTGLNQLVTIDTATGAGAAVGPLGFIEVRGLAFDPVTGTLFGTDTSSDQLLTIDTATGVGTAVGALGFARVEGLAFDANTGVLYGSNVCGGCSDSLIAIDVATGAGSPRGTISGVQDSGAAYVFDLSPPSQTYCTAGVSASNCQATLSATGTPSASAPWGFDLMAAGVEGSKDALFFFGTSGRQATPWGNGASFQCVVPPVARGGLLSGSGTAGACDGTFAQDLNARWTSRPSQNPGAGTMVQSQLWYRDPLNTSHRKTSLSDAIEFVVGP